MRNRFIGIISLCMVFSLLAGCGSVQAKDSSGEETSEVVQSEQDTPEVVSDTQNTPEVVSVQQDTPEVPEVDTDNSKENTKRKRIY